MADHDHAAPNVPVTKPNATATGKSRLTTPELSPRLQHELARIDDEVPFRPRARYTHHTWAQTFFSRPEFFFQPESVAELQKIVTLARRSRKRICVTGYGHSPSTLTCTSSWLINLDHLDRILDFDLEGHDGRVKFEAGISLYDLNQKLAERGYTLPNLGSIDVQSVAGAISTGTHGSSLNHGLLSQNIVSLTVLLSNSQLVTCSADKNVDLFRAALLSLGSLGIIVDITFQAVPDFNIAWSQQLVPLSHILDNWSEKFWKQREYTRVWWLPYLKRAVVWSADHTDEPMRAPNTTFYGGMFGYYLYHNLLAISNWFPRMLPFVEWLIFGMQYGFKPGNYTMSAVEPARDGLKMNCLYSQWVNEWALPLAKGPEAISRLSAWFHRRPESEHRIPFSNQGLYVHCPVEVRVSDTTPARNISKVYPFLDPTDHDGPTLYLNATLYRPYGKDPPCRDRYYEAFEYLMKELGGKPHWAKNFLFTDRTEIQTMYGTDMDRFLKIRDECDPDGMFLGQWHLDNLPLDIDDDDNEKKCVEEEIHRRRMGLGFGDGVLWEGAIKDPTIQLDSDFDAGFISTSREKNGGSAKLRPTAATTSTHDQDNDETPTTTMSITSHASEESFDMMAKTEASFYSA